MTNQKPLVSWFVADCLQTHINKSLILPFLIQHCTTSLLSGLNRNSLLVKRLYFPKWSEICLIYSLTELWAKQVLLLRVNNGLCWKNTSEQYIIQPFVAVYDSRSELMFVLYVFWFFGMWVTFEKSDKHREQSGSYIWLINWHPDPETMMSLIANQETKHTLLTLYCNNCVRGWRTSSPHLGTLPVGSERKY